MGPLTSCPRVRMVGKRSGDHIGTTRATRIRLRLVSAGTLATWLVATLFLTVAPVLALSATCGSVSLTQGGVSPSSGTPGAQFTFTVTYTNSRGGNPTRAQVRFGDFTQIALTGSGDTAAGVVYAGTTTKPNGTWTYRFRFRTNGSWCETPTDTFVVATPTPTPPPTPKPTPKPTPHRPRSRRRHRPRSRPHHRPRSPEPTAEPTARTTAKPTPRPTPKPSPKRGATPKPTPKPSRKPRATATPANTPVVTPGQASPSDRSSGDDETPQPRPTASPTQAVAAVIGRDRNQGPPGAGPTLDVAGVARGIGGVALNPLTVWLLTAAGGTALYLRLVRHARDDDAWSDGLVLATATQTQAARTGPKRRGGAAVVGTSPETAVASPVPGVRTFEATPAKGVERATIGYHKVRISSKPDAVRSVELGRLDRGDEVEILGFVRGIPAGPDAGRHRGLDHETHDRGSPELREWRQGRRGAGRSMRSLAPALLAHAAWAALAPVLGRAFA